MIPKAAILAVLALVAAPAALSAAPKHDGGAVTGQVRIEGRIEKLKSLKTKRFSPYASVYKSDTPPAELDQQLIVYLDGPPAAHPGAPAVLGQKGRNFTASIVPVLPGGEVEIQNQDTVRHHIRSRAKPWDFNLRPRPPGSSVEKSFQAPPKGGLGVVPIYCDIHPNMRAHVLVMPSDHFALLPETGGRFRLEGVPPGTYTLSAWHPTLKPVPMTVTVRPGKTVSVELVMQGKKE